MKCPKCQYVSFENETRCRNCGHVFALEAPKTPVDLSLRPPGAPAGPFADLTLNPSERPPAAVIEEATLAASPQTPPPTSDLPLGPASAPADAPRPAFATITPPRPPLAVRRTPPPIARIRPAVAPRVDRPPELPFVEDVSSERRPAADPIPTITIVPTPLEDSAPRRVVTDAPVEETRERVEPAEIVAPPSVFGARCLAALFDIVLLGGVSLLVLYLTCRVAGVPVREVGRLPMVPLAAFLLLLQGGYLTAFTAIGGSTLGKMIFGIRVVAEDGGPVGVGASALRAAGALASVVLLGVPFFVGAFVRDGRALHDVLAETRVVAS